VRKASLKPFKFAPFFTIRFRVVLDLIPPPPSCVPPDYEIQGSFCCDILPKAVWDGAIFKLYPTEIIN